MAGMAGAELERAGCAGILCSIVEYPWRRRKGTLKIVDQRARRRKRIGAHRGRAGHDAGKVQKKATDNLAAMVGMHLRLVESTSRPPKYSQVSCKIVTIF